MLGEGPIGESGQRAKDSADAFRVHDEGAHVLLGVRVGLEIGDVVSYPELCGLIPPHLLPFGVPRFSRGVARRAVVQNAAICRPRPRPVLVDAESRWIFRAAA